MLSPVISSEKSVPAARALRILYVDDVAELREVLQVMLESDGYSIECAANGLLALEKINADPTAFDLVLTDHHMPTMDGLELVKQLREMEFPGRILVFSSELSLAIAERYEELRVDRVLPKPVAPAILREILAQY